MYNVCNLGVYVHMHIHVHHELVRNVFVVYMSRSKVLDAETNILSKKIFRQT